MLIEIFITLQIATILFFCFAYFTHQELLWGIALILSGVLMVAGNYIELNHYVFNIATGGYDLTTSGFYYPYLTGINMLFFSLALILSLFDLYDKYGQQVGIKGA